MRPRAVRTIVGRVKPDAPLRVAVMGDVHGHLSLAYTLLRRWERETSRTLDLILQVGDFGAFPPPYRLDKATKRFAEHDPDELGFTDYVSGEGDAPRFLAPDAPSRTRIAAETVFIRGNHEDFIFLDEVSRGATGPVPVDAFGRIAYLPNGRAFTFTRRGISLRIAGLGGVSIHGDHGYDPVSEHYTAADVRALRQLDAPVDVLLTHEPPLGAGGVLGPRARESGSRDVAELLAALRPRHHFCGHWHEPGVDLDAPPGVQSHLLHAVNFYKPTRLNRGCIGVLSWSSPDAHTWEPLDAPWLAEYTRSTWRALAR